MNKKECCNINEVVQEYYNYLKSYIRTKVSNGSVADDIVQEVMVKLVEAHQKSNSVENIKAWLFQVSRNTIYDYYKKHNLILDLDNDWNLEDTAPGSHSKIMDEDFIVPMIKLLPSEFSTPLMLSDIDKIPQQKIADQLDLGLSATKMRIQRGRQKLKELFVECCEIEYDKNGGFASCTIKKHCEPLQKIEKELKNK